MKVQAIILRKTEYLLITLALTIVFGLVGKGVYFIYYGTELGKILAVGKKISYTKEF